MNSASEWDGRRRVKQYILTHGNLLTMRDRTIKYDTDILIRDGKIQKIGRNLTAFAAQEAAEPNLAEVDGEADARQIH